MMIANCWPEAAHLEECVSTLRFASRVRDRGRMQSTASGRTLGLSQALKKAAVQPLHVFVAPNGLLARPKLNRGPQVRSLVTDAAVNESADPGLLVKRYERQIKELRQELAMRDMLRWGSMTGGPSPHGARLLNCGAGGLDAAGMPACTCTEARDTLTRTHAHVRCAAHHVHPHAHRMHPLPAAAATWLTMT